MRGFLKRKLRLQSKLYVKIFQVCGPFSDYLVCSQFALLAEFRSYFEHVRSLRFDDRPDYDYLKRMFRELFFRKGFRYDNIYDWDILALPSSERDKLTPDYTTGVEAVERPLGPSDRDLKQAQGMFLLLCYFFSVDIVSDDAEPKIEEIAEPPTPPARVMVRPSPPVVTNEQDTKRITSAGPRTTSKAEPLAERKVTHGYATRAASGGNVRWEG
jgi:hypothetical protein